MVDTYRHKGMRQKLVNEIKGKGIDDERILTAINNVPRHLFLDSSFLEFAYDDKPFPIGSGQTISQPYTVAFQTQLLDIKKGLKVLEVGTGSGYQACVLEELGAKVFSVERQKKLFVRTRDLLKKMKYNAKIFYGDGFKGLKTFAPFDRIIITAAAPEIANDLLDQLKPGGCMVVPFGEGKLQKMLKITKAANGQIIREEHGDFSFVPMLKNKADD